ncbi:DUF6159 family protein [Euryarchaeota archaeon]|nr:DUF6159 family protein [Euryarchaeota archaeon]MDB4865207.1 DUF6159 family protein [Euryarchaeota archaeon]MDC3282109.1 DUF6159 family protein [Euryarchaeota archaeon]
MDTYESSPNDGKFGFMNRIKRGFRITKLGIHVVKADPELMVYLLFSGIMSVLSFGAVLTFTGGLGFVIGNDEGFEGGVAVGTFISYFIVSVITVFWNAAIIASAYERMTTGRNPSFSYGIKQAMKCFPQILIWGLISGTVGVIISFFEAMANSDNIAVAIIGRIISIMISFAWWMTTFFVVPMIVLEKNGVFESMGKSPELFERTWGENIVASAGTGIINFIVILTIIIVCLPLFIFGEIGAALAFILIVIGIAISSLFFTACDAVNKASMYYYAKTGEEVPLAQKYGLDTY